MAAADLVDSGHKIVLDGAGCYALHKASGHVMKIHRRNRVFEADFKVMSPEALEAAGHPGPGPASL